MTVFLNKKCHKLLATVFFATAVHTVSAADYQSGIESLKAGRTEEARVVFAELYKMNPSDTRIKFSYAESSPCSTALRLYAELSKAEPVPDSIKACALARMGDYNYASLEYSKAVEYYRQAAAKGKDPKYRHVWALASLASGDEEAANSIWYTISLEYGNDLSQMANYYLGLIQLKKKNYQKAHDLFLKAGTVDPNKSWTIPSLAGKLECAMFLGHTEKAKEYRTQLDPYKKDLLEKSVLLPITTDTKVVTPVVKPNNTKATSAVQPKDTTGSISEKEDMVLKPIIYTLQIGAFGSSENAVNLQKKLSKTYKNVTVATVLLTDQMFYRVRIGNFDSKEDAELFAQDSMAKLGFTCKVVEK
jgi:tetratricopeptide (TPR) repeat protein